LDWGLNITNIHLTIEDFKAHCPCSFSVYEALRQIATKKAR